MPPKKQSATKRECDIAFEDEDDEDVRPKKPSATKRECDIAFEDEDDDDIVHLHVGGTHASGAHRHADKQSKINNLQGESNVLAKKFKYVRKDLQMLITELGDLSDPETCQRILKSNLDKKRSLFKKEAGEEEMGAPGSPKKEDFDEGAQFKQLMSYLKEVAQKYNQKMGKEKTA